MKIKYCGSCGKPFFPGTEPWMVVDPGRPVPADWLCAECERTLTQAGGSSSLPTRGAMLRRCCPIVGYGPLDTMPGNGRQPSLKVYTVQ